ncbi:3-hydroxyacyl-ACP dehydratase [Aliikangiella sp. G2MR2-5]|uniref:ApeP family dehydratase n=1 Tax=Aliikangiella sp. G2MR2-5 TaxID=2788943 RepID=UPI0018AA5F97|nr:3-hydroxyacyl-ACP dehydratase [Aliikangiella sp. G2MR2-5]
MSKSATKADLERVVQEHPIENLIPHSQPMVLIDRIVNIETDSLVAEIDIHQHVRFWDEASGGVPTWVAIEYMAQAIAALAGCKALALGESVKLGFLLGSRKFGINRPVLESEKTFKILVEQLYMDDSGLASFQCKVADGINEYANAKLNVFETDDVSQVLAG